MIKPLNIGDVFGFLTIESNPILVPKGNGHYRTYYECRCICGNKRTARRDHLTSGHNVSCGCYNRQRSTTHGGHSTRLYSIWKGMRQRCENSNHTHWNSYGGRGINVCDEWQSFEPFAAWAKANGYADNLTIDRIDNDKGYEPGNCRWATVQQQAQNTRRKKLITYMGETKNAHEWAKDTRCKVDGPCLYLRVFKLKWDLDRAFNTPSRAKGI